MSFGAVRFSRRRFLLRRCPRLRDDALQAFDLLAQLCLLLRYLLLLAVKRRGRFARTPKHRHHLLASQAKTAMAMTPKRISGKLSARPICNHSENERPPVFS